MNTTFAIVEEGHAGNWVGNTYTAAKSGQCTMRASYASHEAQFTLTVEPNTLAQLALSAELDTHQTTASPRPLSLPLSATTGETRPMARRGRPSDGYPHS